MTLGELREALLGLGAPDLCVSPAGPLIIDVALGDRHQKVRIAADREWCAPRSLRTPVCGRKP